MTIQKANENYKERNGDYPYIRILENDFMCINDFLLSFPETNIKTVLNAIKHLIGVIEKDIGKVCIIKKEGRSGGTYAHPAVLHAVAAIVSPEYFYSIIQYYDIFWESSANDVQELKERRMADKLYADIFKGKEEAGKIKDTVIYLIKDGKHGSLKIGISNNPRKRIKAFACGSISNYEIVYSSRLMKQKDASDIEKSLHKKYNDSNIAREWFNIKIKEAVIADIEKMQASEN